ncbi:peptidoglycan-recognition protein SC1a/b-like [Xyrauchen texanus]|uniref:peptidoglycan-recognition protein SC1a/b-like n=1 Tax=Xyrauchen texanus TaxID=154827 RepID=UPI002241AED8|nr:peptidoglycan-recognition protein SC1a/b-like [Xyrauchen texanus]
MCFLVSGDGTVYEGRGWGVLGAHAKEHHIDSVVIDFMGNFSEFHATLRLLHVGVLHNHLQPNYVLVGHRDVANTECPGEHLHSALPKLRDRLRNDRTQSIRHVKSQ